MPWDKRTVIEFVSPFPVVRSADPVELTGPAKICVDEGAHTEPKEAMCKVVFTELRKQLSPEYEKETRMRIVEGKGGRIDVGVDRHGLFTRTKVIVTIDGIHPEIDHLGHALHLVNHLVKIRSIKEGYFMVPFLVRGDIPTCDIRFYSGNELVGNMAWMFSANMVLAQLLEDHLSKHQPFRTLMAREFGSPWVEEAYEAYSELQLERALPALVHVSLAFELFINKALFSTVGQCGEGSLRRKCTHPDLLPRALGGSLEDRDRHGEYADKFSHIVGLRNAVLHEARLQYVISSSKVPDQKEPVSLATWDDVVAHFDRVTDVVEYIAARLAK